MQAVAAEGITYTLDQMDSDIISRLKTPDGSLVLLPYPVVTVDMGQHLARMKTPAEIETLWLDYVLELASEARSDPARDATTVVTGIHPFVVGTPDGAAASSICCGAPADAATDECGTQGGIEAHTGGAPRRNLRAIKDPKRNGGKSMEQLVEHMAEDTFVGWGWAPGAEREPGAWLIRAWVDSGASCPAS
jgi:hypothetical protein